METKALVTALRSVLAGGLGLTGLAWFGLYFYYSLKREPKKLFWTPIRKSIRSSTLYLMLAVACGWTAVNLIAPTFDWRNWFGLGVVFVLFFGAVNYLSGRWMIYWNKKLEVRLEKQNEAYHDSFQSVACTGQLLWQAASGADQVPYPAGVVFRTEARFRGHRKLAYTVSVAYTSNVDPLGFHEARLRFLQAGTAPVIPEDLKKLVAGSELVLYQGDKEIASCQNLKVLTS